MKPSARGTRHRRSATVVDTVDTYRPTSQIVAVILATAAGVSIMVLTVAAMIDALSNPGTHEISTQYASLLTGTLGVLVGSLAGSLAGHNDPMPAARTAVVPEDPGRAADVASSTTPTTIAPAARPGTKPTL